MTSINVSHSVKVTILGAWTVIPIQDPYGARLIQVEWKVI